MQGIYRIRNKIDNKRYVGSTVSIRDWWYMHRSVLRRNKHGNPRLQDAWNQYGEGNFVLEVEEAVVGDEKVLLACEQIYLDEGFALDILYNIAKDAERPLKKSLGYWETHDGPFKGKTFTAAAREQMSKSGREKKFTKEHKQNISISKKGCVPWNKDIPCSKECKEKIREKSSRPYQAFYNIIMGAYIPAGRNLKKMCEERELPYMNMFNLKSGITKQSKDGWRLATKEENNVSLSKRTCM